MPFSGSTQAHNLSKVSRSRAPEDPAPGHVCGKHTNPVLARWGGRAWCWVQPLHLLGLVPSYHVWYMLHMSQTRWDDSGADA